MKNSLQAWKNAWQSQSGGERVLKVRWLLNPEQPPLENMAITEQNGHILDIRPVRASMSDILPIILIPTLVNAHTHLEFSTLTEPIRPAQPFQDWIAAVIQSRRGVDSSRPECIAKGLTESRQGGVTVVGEITTASPVARNDVANDSTVISFREIIGLRQEQIPELLRVATEHLTQHAVVTRDNRVIGGISPHAPYTVHPELFESLIELAVNRDAVLAMHLAETRDELQLLQNGTGRFMDFHKRLGVWDSATFPGGRSIREFLESMSRAPRALAIHGNYFSNDDIRFLAKCSNISTVYCPRTHAFFGHSTHPIQRLLGAGARVILGTDSRASNPDLSLWKELQYVAAHYPEITIPQLLAMVTTHAADALGLPADRHQIREGVPLQCVMLNAGGNEVELSGLICDASTQPIAILSNEP